MSWREQRLFALQPPSTARAVMVEQRDRIVREHGLAGRSARFGKLYLTLCGMGRAERLREPCALRRSR